MSSIRMFSLLGVLQTLLFLFVTPAHADSCLDTDGDGWGWDGSASCLVSSSDQPASGNPLSDSDCMDTDGDGWGWDGSASCLVASGSQPESSDAVYGSDCIDADGDGWGWDGGATCLVAAANETALDDSPAGSRECIDTDGDGWGWDGSASCQMSSDEGLVQAPDDTGCVNGNLCTEPGESYVTRSSDPSWRVCLDETGQDSSDAWQIEDARRDGPGTILDRVCVKACAQNSTTFIADSDFPGWGWDSARASACVAASDSVSQGDIIRAPLYLPDSSPARQQFSDPLVVRLFAGGGHWSCAHQRRRLSSESFRDTGTYIDYQFMSDGRLKTSDSSTSVFSVGLWSIGRDEQLAQDGEIPSRFIRLSEGPNTAISNNAPMIEAAGTPSYFGFMQLKDNSLSIYQTTVDRLQCSTDRAADITASYPLSTEDISLAPTLSPGDLEDVVLACTKLQTLWIFYQGAYYGGTGFQSAEIADDSAQIVTLQPVTFDETSAARDGYLIANGTESGLSGSYVWRGRIFDSFNPAVGEVYHQGITYTTLEFKQFQKSVIVRELKSYAGGSGSSPTDYTSYYSCDRQ